MNIDIRKGIAGALVLIVLAGCGKSAAAVNKSTYSASGSGYTTSQTTSRPTSKSTAKATPKPTKKATPKPTPKPTSKFGTPWFEGNLSSYDFETEDTPNSTAFSMIGYDKDAKVLLVEFRDSGSRYLYFGFSSSDYKAFSSASSLGKYFNSNIKGQFDCERVD